jgi:hypothetical protein
MNNFYILQRTAVERRPKMAFINIPQVFHFKIISIGPEKYYEALRRHDAVLPDGSVIYPQNLETYRCRCDDIVTSPHSDTLPILEKSVNTIKKEKCTIVPSFCNCTITTINTFEYEIQSAQYPPMYILYDSE